MIDRFRRVPILYIQLYGKLLYGLATTRPAAARPVNYEVGQRPLINVTRPDGGLVVATISVQYNREIIIQYNRKEI